MSPRRLPPRDLPNLQWLQAVNLPLYKLLLRLCHQVAHNNPQADKLLPQVLEAVLNSPLLSQVDRELLLLDLEEIRQDRYNQLQRANQLQQASSILLHPISRQLLIKELGAVRPESGFKQSTSTSNMPRPSQTKTKSTSPFTYAGMADGHGQASSSRSSQTPLLRGRHISPPSSPSGPSGRHRSSTS